MTCSVFEGSGGPRFLLAERLVNGLRCFSSLHAHGAADARDPPSQSIDPDSLPRTPGSLRPTLFPCRQLVAHSRLSPLHPRFFPFLNINFSATYSVPPSSACLTALLSAFRSALPVKCRLPTALPPPTRPPRAGYSTTSQRPPPAHPFAYLFWLLARALFSPSSFLTSLFLAVLPFSGSLGA